MIYNDILSCYDFTGVVLSAFISCNDVGPIRNSCRVPVHYLSIIPDTAETTRTSLRETCSIFCISLSASNINNHTMTIQPIISFCSSSILLKKSCNVAAKYNNPRSRYRVNNATPTSHFRLFYDAVLLVEFQFRKHRILIPEEAQKTHPHSLTLTFNTIKLDKTTRLATTNRSHISICVTNNFGQDSGRGRACQNLPV